MPIRTRGLTHSRTLMPLVDGMLSDRRADSWRTWTCWPWPTGPGSFTGLRIGVSALKGLAWAADKPCCGVSTLEAMARNLRSHGRAHRLRHGRPAQSGL